jgi:alanyl aminopeptidase
MEPLRLRLLIPCLFLICAPLWAAAPGGPLPRDVVPAAYHLELAIDPDRAGFEGRVEIEIDVRRPTARIWLHAREVELRAARLEREGAATLALVAGQASTGDGGLLALDAPEPLTPGRARLSLDFAAPYDRRLEGTYVVERDGRRYVMTQMQPLGARRSFPCFDEPAFKTPWHLAIRAPAGQRVFANTAVEREEALADGWVRHVFRATEPLPSYLLAYAVGPWDLVEHAPLPPTAERAHPLPLRGIAVAGRGAEMGYALERVQPVLEALEAWFGLPYPYDKLDIVAAPDFAAGAMENPDLILYREGLLFVDPGAPPDVQRALYGIHAHELAHQWFGNLVTMPWWDDLWLNEAFATWMATKITEQLRPDLGAERVFRDRVFATMTADSLATARRIAEPVEDWREIEAAFDGITYAKGGALLGMIEAWLGEERVRDAVRAYLRRHAHGSARGGDLIEALAGHADDPEAVRSVLGSFLRQPGVPELGLAPRCEDGRMVIAVSQRRYLPLGSDADPEMAWTIPICLRFGNDEREGSHCSVLAAVPEQLLALPAAVGCPAWVMPNRAGAGYFRFHLDPPWLAALAARTDRLDEAELHAYADALGAAFRAGRLGLEDWLRATAPLASLSAPEVALAPVSSLRWLGRHVFTEEPQASLFRRLVAERHAPALASQPLDAPPAETVAARRLRLQLLELLAGDARAPELRLALAERARTALAAEDLEHFSGLGADGRELALRVLVEDAGAEVFQPLIERLHASADPRFRGQLLRALGHVRIPELRLQALELALSPQVASGEILALLGPLFDDPDAAPAARAWYALNEEALHARLPMFAQSRVPALYGAAACSEGEAAALENRFAERMAETDGGPRALAQAVERVRLCAALKEALTER